MKVRAHGCSYGSNKKGASTESFWQPFCSPTNTGPLCFLSPNPNCNPRQNPGPTQTSIYGSYTQGARTESFWQPSPSLGRPFAALQPLGVCAFSLAKSLPYPWRHTCSSMSCGLSRTGRIVKLYFGNMSCCCLSTPRTYFASKSFFQRGDLGWKYWALSLWLLTLITPRLWLELVRFCGF